ncbi:hypothetical protein [Actinocorallia sp. A-T 12471]|uniref:hypothetical protein n=1 Tax=Actinocorallia sp. A-T 12471 TaxID=3089813 RepID=UPI0029CDECFE|nr:hypothetical protein [Actinocorallia sp. A-T 12471]MDX6740691.1 hypothetical protein [Actinocorallia sp. A-T 12471]
MATPDLRLSRLRGTWLYGTLLLSFGAFAVVIALAPAPGTDPGRALTGLLFLGSSMHVAATGWFYTLPEIRAHARANLGRYATVPLALVAGTAAVAAALTEPAFRWALYAFFAWQFFHFQKQNLGMAALTAGALRAGSLSRAERDAITVTGLAGTVALLSRPELLALHDARLGWVFPVACAVFLAGIGLGLHGMRRRRSRPPAFAAVYLGSLLFFTPVFVLDAPYAAVAGLIVAHGLQYLLIVGMVAVTPRPGGGLPGVATMFAVALVGGLLLNLASHLHGSPHAWERALYGAFLGVTMAHFVIDAGLWRLRDEFPRRFLTAHLPYLLKP